ncbi:hypothetical protein BJ875DRAFT_482624 [Amylocarpus encephaloides]|uniref:Uncharacterized protein n=1 Tax=Amylocarpus encephaloides TaxID=45428 RepID=A0A9P7YM30_9HELO|nr:hypothetical protein BJ875DRAFT_482624 [Amylocarpus encephaloides]
MIDTYLVRQAFPGAEEEPRRQHAVSGPFPPQTGRHFQYNQEQSYLHASQTSDKPPFSWLTFLGTLLHYLLFILAIQYASIYQRNVGFAFGLALAMTCFAMFYEVEEDMEDEAEGEAGSDIGWSLE